MVITGGVGVPAAIDAVGGKLGSEAIRALSINGVMFVYGLLSTEPIVIDTAQMVWWTWPAECAAIASRDAPGAIRTENIGTEQELGEYFPAWVGGLAWAPFRQQQ
jgi:NADPH:quinone reductase-like Zn-dependent oxidoreductase